MENAARGEASFHEQIIKPHFALNIAAIHILPDAVCRDERLVQCLAGLG